MGSAERPEARTLVTAEPLVAGAVLIGIGSLLCEIAPAVGVPDKP